jgi:hypothetical protein
MTRNVPASQCALHIIVRVYSLDTPGVSKQVYLQYQYMRGIKTDETS